MSTPAHRVRYTYAEYLTVERYSNIKHEFLDGQIYAMGGGTPEHAALIAAIPAVLHARLRGGNCHVYASELRVRTASGLSTYPDVTVVCGPSERFRDDHDAITNPALIIEVLSRSTEDYDRGDKFEHYKTLASLQQYVLVSQHEHAVEVWTRRAGDVWTSATFHDGEVAQLSIGAQLDVRELYETAAEPTS